MPLRFEKGKLRPQPPRLKDVSARATDHDRDRNHGTNGRFKRGNRAAAGKAAKAIIRRHLGADAGDERVEGLYRDSRTMYRATLRELPCTSPAVAELVARLARSARH